MSLLASLVSSASALSVFDRAVATIQNNVSNASTVDYASQSLTLDALPFDPAAGLLGGVRAGEMVSTRNELAETAVQRQQTAFGTFDQKTTSLNAVQGALDLSSASGIPATLGNLFQSFSAWSLSPASSISRQAVIDNAHTVAVSFNTAATKLERAGQDNDQQILQTVDQINADGAKLRDYNIERRSGNRTDAGLDAKIHSTLEDLSLLVGFTSTIEPDGTATVLLGGQTPLVIGTNEYSIASQFAVPAGAAAASAPGPPSAVINDSAGRDITAQITGGHLGALLDIHNNVLASLLGDSSQPGRLNQMAQAFADRVNQILTAGSISDGPPPVPGIPLFSYDTSNATRVAATLAVDPAATQDQLAAIDPGPPYVSNGTALNLVALDNPQDAADEINNLSYAQFYGNVAAGVGRELANATDQRDIQQQLVTQAQSVREQISGVSLDQQAVLLLDFQRVYQANAKFVTVLDELTQTAVGLIK